MEVLHVNILVRGGFPLTPQQQTFLGSDFLHRDVLNGKSQNNSPDHTQCHFQIFINDFYINIISNNNQSNIIYRKYKICLRIILLAPIDTNFTPLLAMKSRALLTLVILWKRILPLSGFGSVSPEITSKSNISLRPLWKSG
jgi:hypothetical protein